MRAVDVARMLGALTVARVAASDPAALSDYGSWIATEMPEPIHDALPDANDSRLLVDIDLAILGASVERFDEYERQVRQEYSWVPDPLFRGKRREILEAFLARPHLFNTDYFRSKLEAQARANLAPSVTSLRG